MTIDDLKKLEAFIKAKEADFSLSYKNGEWYASLVFGQESEDSPIAGGHAVGVSPRLLDALSIMANELNI